MNNKIYFKGTVALVLLSSVAVSYWHLGSNEEQQTSHQEPETAAISYSISSGVTGDVRLLSGKNKLQQPNDKAVTNISEQEPELDVVAKQLAAISEAYASALKYPPYSKPISEQSLSYLEPNFYNEVEIQVLDGRNTASLSLDKFRFFYPESLTVSLNTKLAVNNIKFEFYQPSSKKVLLTEQTAEKSVVVTSDESWPQEMRVKATIDFEQGTDILISDFHFYVPVAHVMKAGTPTSQGADMIIPLFIDVKQAGIYRVRANLFASDGKVIAALNAKGRLTEGEGVLDLKVHSSVLAGSDGNYQLKHWVVEKMSGYPGDKGSYGVSEQEVITLEPFDLDLLSQEPYQPSPEEQQKLDFLSQAARQ